MGGWAISLSPLEVIIILLQLGSAQHVSKATQTYTLRRVLNSFNTQGSFHKLHI